MDLLVHQMNQLQHVDVPDGHIGVEGLTAAAVEQRRLAVLAHQPLPVAIGASTLDDLQDLVLPGAVEDRRRHLGPRIGPLYRRAGPGEGLPTLGCGPAEMGLQDLTQVHPGGHSEW